jgi:V/A-type H+-transporting ATPase subunit E
MPFPNTVDLLSQAVTKKAEEEARDILAKAKKQAEGIIKKAEVEAKVRFEQNLSRLKEEKYLEARNITSTAELKAKRLLLTEKETLVTEILEEAKKRLLNVKKQARYKQILLNLIEDGLKELRGERFKIMLSDSDKTRLNNEDLQTITKKTGKMLTLSEEKTAILGGCVVMREDGHLLYDNSFEALFHKNETALKAEIGKRLFG